MSMVQRGRNLDTEQWQELDRLHHLHPFTDSKVLHKKGSRVITRADGVYLWDSEESAKSYMESDLRKSIGAAYNVEGAPRTEKLTVVELLRP